MRYCILLLFAVSAYGQMFNVLNPKHLPFNQEEANKCYLQAVDRVSQQYHLVERITPALTVVLGADKDGVKLPGNSPKNWAEATTTLYLRRWNRSSFRQGVMAAIINQLLSLKNLADLDKPNLDLDRATVDVKDLKH